jgi:hypothetical protein
MALTCNLCLFLKCRLEVWLFVGRIILKLVLEEEGRRKERKIDRMN